jgi:hypothetical protein
MIKPSSCAIDLAWGLENGIAPPPQAPPPEPFNNCQQAKEHVLPPLAAKASMISTSHLPFELQYSSCVIGGLLGAIIGILLTLVIFSRKRDSENEMIMKMLHVFLSNR